MDGKENDKVLDKVRQYQNSIIKHSELGNDEKILSYISRLYEMPITVAHLQETGVGRTINSLRKYSGSVGHASRAIVSKWKNMVSKEEEENGCNQSDEEFSAHDSPTSSDEVKKMKTRERERERESESEEKQSKRPESSDKSSRKSSKSKSEDSGSSSSHSKSHHHQHHHHQHHHHHHHRKEEKRDSHKSSHSRDKEKRREDRDRDGRKSKERSDDRKRRHEDEPSPGKKKRYESEEEEEELELELELEQEQEQEDRGRDEEVQQEVEEEDEEDEDDEDEVVESENESMQCDDNTYNGNFLPEVEEYPDSSPQTQPDSTTLPEESFVEKKSSSKSTSKRHEKSRSSSKHRESEKEVNGAGHSSSKKDSNERKHSSSKEKEKPSSSSSSSSNKKEAKSFSSGKSDSEPSSKMKNKKKTATATATTTTKTKNLLIADGGIDSGSGASFAEALGMIEPTRTSATKQSFKKKTSHHSTSGSPIPIPIQIPTATPAPSTSTSSSSRTPKSSTLSPLNQSPNLLSPCTKLEPLDLNIGPQLPEITTNYKPLGHYNYNNDASASSSQRNNIGTKMLSEEEALCAVISSKTQRTKVFSGNKVNSGFVPTLFNLCVRVLQENIDALEYTGGVPYEILKPVLERATANQLLNAEYHNPYLVEDSDKLWELHCKRECRGLKRQEMESWRDMYLRCRDERDAKLKALTVNIKQSIDKSLPVRQTKLAYVDTMVKPPRGIARKQAKYGTDKKPIITPSSRLNSLTASGSGEKISVPNPGARSVSSSSSSSATMLKPKKAPLMQKTMAMLKSRFRR